MYTELFEPNHMKQKLTKSYQNWKKETLEEQKKVWSGNGTRQNPVQTIEI